MDILVQAAASEESEDILTHWAGSEGVRGYPPCERLPQRSPRTPSPAGDRWSPWISLQAGGGQRDVQGYPRLPGCGRWLEGVRRYPHLLGCGR